MRFLWTRIHCQQIWTGRFGTKKILFKELPEQSFTGKDKGKTSSAPVQKVRSQTEIFEPPLLQLKGLTSRHFGSTFRTVVLSSSGIEETGRAQSLHFIRFQHWKIFFSASCADCWHFSRNCTVRLISIFHPGRTHEFTQGFYNL